MGEAILSGLGAGLRGLQQGLLLKRQMRQDDADRASQASRDAMQQREFEFRMKQLGLALEGAEFERDYRLAQGTPAEVAEREHQARLNEIAHKAQEWELDKRYKEAQIEKMQTDSDVALYNATGGGKENEIDTRFEKVAKLAEMKLKQLNEQRDQTLARGGDTSEIDAEIQRVYNTEYEPALNAQMQQYGVTPTVQEQPEPAPVPAAAPSGPQNATTALGALFGGVLQNPAVQSITSIPSQAAEITRTANINTQNPNTSMGQRMGAGIARNVIMDALLGAATNMGGGRGGMAIRTPATGPMPPQPDLIKLLFGVADQHRLNTGWGPQSGASF